MGDTNSPTGGIHGTYRLLALALPVVVVAAMVASYLVGTRQSTPAAPPPPGTAVPITLKPQPIDVGFAQDMMDHHDQAVQMALLAINTATSQPVRTMALGIATDQRREMGILDQFLRDRGVTHVDPTRTVMTWMNEPTPHDQMPGLASREKIVALTNAQGADVDLLFIELMLEHHEGGIHMAQYAAEHAETQYIRDLASRIVVAQNHEISDLRQLTADGG